ncbi:MAG: TraR/DksA C4-type zinc finger protein [Candidatus Nanopelagicales bacterium]|nr:TraR/DksA C4-type zinc finger protein [Candidatus Nanopelagicales bacterium]
MAETLDFDEASMLLNQVRIANEADLAHAREVLKLAAEDGSAIGNLTDEVTAARYMEADASSILKEVDEALSRISSGTYGRCEVCGGGIAAERLQVRPYIKTCISCASKV